MDRSSLAAMVLALPREGFREAVTFPCYTPKAVTTTTTTISCTGPCLQGIQAALPAPNISSVSPSCSSLAGHLEICPSRLADQGKCSRAEGFGTRAGISLITSLPHVNPGYTGKTRNLTLSPSPFPQPHCCSRSSCPIWVPTAPPPHC